MIDRLYHLFGLASPVALAAVLIVIQVDNLVARLIAGFLLVFLLPGAGFATAVFPTGPDRWVEWIIAAVALSLGLNIMGGFVLHLSPFGLTRTSWAILLGGVALLTDVGRHSDLGWKPPIRLSVPAIVQGGLLLSAAVVASGALMLSIQGLEVQPRLGYSVLWGQPSDDRDGGMVLHLGVSNAEGGEASYRLSAKQDGASLGEWPSIHLGVGEAWTGAVELPNRVTRTAPIVATLYRGESDTVYRQILIWPTENLR